MLGVACVKWFICIISFNSLNCFARCILSPFLELKKLIINHTCDKWSMIYCSSDFCRAYLAFYNKMGQARNVRVLSADMDQAGAELSLLQVLMAGTQCKVMKWLSQGPKIIGLEDRENFQPCFSYLTVPLIVLLWHVNPCWSAKIRGIVSPLGSLHTTLFQNSYASCHHSSVFSCNVFSLWYGFF